MFVFYEIEHLRVRSALFGVGPRARFVDGLLADIVETDVTQNVKATASQAQAFRARYRCRILSLIVDLDFGADGRPADAATLAQVDNITEKPVVCQQESPPLQALTNPHESHGLASERR
jgi:hypothetical protein